MSTNEDFVRASLSGDAATASTAFNELMLSKVASSIDSIRVTAAQTLFNPGVDNGVPDSNES